MMIHDVRQIAITSSQKDIRGENIFGHVPHIID
jgi:hypothetical protein